MAIHFLWLGEVFPFFSHYIFQSRSLPSTLSHHLLSNVDLLHVYHSYSMGYGDWSEDKRGSYNKWDAVTRCTTQVCFFFSPSCHVKIDMKHACNDACY